MAIGINYAGNAPGRGGYGRPLFARGNDRRGVVFGTFDLDTSYPTGGYDISALFSEFKLEANAANLHLMVMPRAGYQFDVDYTNKKLLAYQQSAATSALTQVPNATNLSAVTGVRYAAFAPLG